MKLKKGNNVILGDISPNPFVIAFISQLSFNSVNIYSIILKLDIWFG